MHFNWPLPASVVKSLWKQLPKLFSSHFSFRLLTDCPKSALTLSELCVIRMSLIAFFTAWFSLWMQEGGACCCSAESGRMSHDLFTVLCCAMCFTYNNTRFRSLMVLRTSLNFFFCACRLIFSSGGGGTVGNASCSIFLIGSQ